MRRTLISMTMMMVLGGGGCFLKEMERNTTLRNKSEMRVLSQKKRVKAKVRKGKYVLRIQSENGSPARKVKLKNVAGKTPHGSQNSQPWPEFYQPFIYLNGGC